MDSLVQLSYCIDIENKTKINKKCWQHYKVNKSEVGSILHQYILNKLKQMDGIMTCEVMQEN